MSEDFQYRSKHPTDWFFRHPRITITLVGIPASIVLWWLADTTDVATSTGSLFVNLSASVFTIVITVLLLDWLQQKHRDLENSFPRYAARHELGSACFALGLTLGNLFLRDFKQIITKHVKAGNFTATTLTELRTDWLRALSGVEEGSLASISRERVPGLITSLNKEVTRIDDVIRRYGYSLDANLRDKALLFQDRIVSMVGVLEGSDNLPLNSQLIFLSVKQLADSALDVNRLVAK